MPPKSGREPMVPAAAVREIAERWLLGFETPEDGYQRLAANSTVQADSWRKRFGMTWAPGRKRLPPGVEGPGVMYPAGWWAQKELRESYVDEFLTAAGLMHLWFEPPLGKPVSEIRPSDEDFDATCAVCGAISDWSSSVAGVRVELRRPRKWGEWWSWCACCAADELPIPKLASGNRRWIPDEELRRLYKLYVRESVGVDGIAAPIWRRYGFASGKSCVVALIHAWRAQGVPLRSRSESKRRNAKLRKPSTGRLTPQQVRQAYLLHTQRDLSLNELGKRLAPTSRSGRAASGRAPGTRERAPPHTSPSCSTSAMRRSSGSRGQRRRYATYRPQ